jgi:hypothetical protein
MQRFSDNMNKLFKLARLIDNKYNINIFAEEDSLQAEVVERVKNSLKELYDNFFNEEIEAAKKNKVISMKALFFLKKDGEPNIIKLFHLMNKLISNIDNLNSEELFNMVDEVLIAANLNSDIIKSYIDEIYSKDRASEEFKKQIIRGLENRLESITKRLSTAKKILLKFPLIKNEVVSLPSRTLSYNLINRFLISPAADKHHLTKDNWLEIYDNPRFRQRLVKLVNSWERNKEVFDSELESELKQMADFTR